jgi:hypothetical protein
MSAGSWRPPALLRQYRTEAARNLVFPLARCPSFIRRDLTSAGRQIPSILRRFKIDSLALEYDWPASNLVEDRDNVLADHA